MRRCIFGPVKIEHENGWLLFRKNEMLGIPRNGIGGGAGLEPFLRDDAALRNGCPAVSQRLFGR